MAALSHELELARLGQQKCDDAPPGGLQLFEVEATCRGNAADVLRRTAQVLDIVLHRASGSWPSLAEWLEVLPSWFVEVCGPEQSQAEAQAWLERWREMPPEEQERELADQPWSVGEFLHWFQPSQREWWWWGATTFGQERLLVCLAVEELTPSHEALDWLLRAAGAVEVIDENLRDLDRDQ